MTGLRRLRRPLPPDDPTAFIAMFWCSSLVSAKYTVSYARSSIWRDRIAENSSANPSSRWACRFTSEVNLL
jgi:hypothetical protein